MTRIIQFPQIKPAFPYPGGKSRLLKYILPHIPRHHTYVEPFCGGAAVLLAKPHSSYEVINDVNGDMVSFFRYAKFHAPALLAELDGWPASRKNFMDLKAAAPLTDLQRAARWYWLQVSSFGGKGKHFGRGRDRFIGYDREVHGERIRALSLRLRKVVIECLDWQKVVDFYDHEDAFFYFDPPYMQCADTAYAEWDSAQMRALSLRLRALKAKYLLSVNDSPATREIFAGIPAVELKIKYSLASNPSGNPSGELLVGNALKGQPLTKDA